MEWSFNHRVWKALGVQVTASESLEMKALSLIMDRGFHFEENTCSINLSEPLRVEQTRLRRVRVAFLCSVGSGLQIRSWQYRVSGEFKPMRHFVADGFLSYLVTVMDPARQLPSTKVSHSETALLDESGSSSCLPTPGCGFASVAVLSLLHPVSRGFH